MDASPSQGLPRQESGPPVWRRLFHLSVGSIAPLVGIFVPQVPMVVGLGIMAGAGLALDLARFRVPSLNRTYLRLLAPLLKREEDRRITGATFMLIAAALAFLFFETHQAVACMLFLSLGDPVAALVGRRMPGPRLFGKSPGGTLAFIAVSALVVAVLVGAGVSDYHWGLVAGGVVAGLVELAPLKLDDNLTIPLLSGAFMRLVGA